MAKKMSVGAKIVLVVGLLVVFGGVASLLYMDSQYPGSLSFTLNGSYLDVLLQPADVRAFCDYDPLQYLAGLDGQFPCDGSRYGDDQ